MKKVLLLVVFFISVLACSGQMAEQVDLLNPTSKYRRIPDNTIHAELFGQALFISLNYERIVLRSGNFYLTGRTGIGFMPPTYTTWSVPLLGSCLLRVSNGFLFELGAGFSFTYTSWPDHYSGGLFSGTNYKSGSLFDPLATGFAGFRSQGKSGFQFRFGFTPLFELTKESDKQMLNKQFANSHMSILPWIGLSFGYSFN